MAVSRIFGLLDVLSMKCAAQNLLLMERTLMTFIKMYKEVIMNQFPRYIRGSSNNLYQCVCAKGLENDLQLSNL